VRPPLVEPDAEQLAELERILQIGSQLSAA
jgi:hypothetical protein